MTEKYENPEKIQYQVTHPIEDTIDDGSGNYNISPLGFPDVDVSSTIPQNPTRITPNFYTSYKNQLSGETPDYTEKNTNIEDLSEGGLLSFTLSVSLSGSGSIVTATTSAPHGYITGKTIVIAGAVESGFNGSYTIIVTGTSIFTYSAAGTGTPTGTITSKYQTVTGDLIKLTAQTNTIENGWYKAKTGPWQIISIDTKKAEIINSNSTANIVSLSGTATPIVHTVVSLSGDGTTVTCITENLKSTIEQGHGLKTGETVTIAGANEAGFNGAQTITVTNGTTFTYTDTGSGTATGTITATYALTADDIINVIKQTTASQNGIYIVKSSDWEFYGVCYVYDGTENDNVAGIYDDDADGNTITHYRRGYSHDEVATYLREKLDTTIEFGRFRGSKRTDHGPFIQWLMGGRRVNIGGDGANKEIFVEPFGLGQPAEQLARTDGVVNPLSESEVASKKTEINRLNKYTRWGLTSFHAQNFTGVAPYVKDWPFIVNSENNGTIFDVGLFPVSVDIDNWRLTAAGVSDINIRPLSQQVTYYHKDNSYHNNITLDLNDEKIYGRQHISILHNLEDVDTTYNNAEIVTALNDLDGITFSTDIDVIRKITTGTIIKYYYNQRGKGTITDITTKGSGWTTSNLTYESSGANGIKIYIETTETDYVEFSHTTKTTAELLEDLKNNNDIIPGVFAASETDDWCESNLKVLFIDNTLIDTEDSVNQTEKIRAKKTFVHLPTPINLPDGQSLELDVSLPIEQEKENFSHNTVGSLSGYRNFVSQPRLYVFSGYQSCNATDLTVSTLTRSGTTATITTSLSHGISTSENVRIIVKGALQDEYNGEFDALATAVNKFQYTVEGSPTTPATGSIKIDRIISVDGEDRVKGLTERNNSYIFSPMPEVEFAEDGNIYHQPPMKIADIENTDKRVLIATVYPTSTNTFAWRLDNDPQFRLLKWSLLSLSGGTGSAAHVAYNRNKNIVDEYSEEYNASIIETSATTTRTVITIEDNFIKVGDRFEITEADVDIAIDETIVNYEVGDYYIVSKVISTTTFEFVGKSTIIDGTAVVKIKYYPFDSSLMDNPLTYNSTVFYKENEYTTRINQILVSYTRVLLPDKLIPESSSDFVSDENIKTYASYVYQASRAYNELVADFHRGRIIVASSPQINDAGDVESRTGMGVDDAYDVEEDRSSDYSIKDAGNVVERSEFFTDVLAYEICYDNNHGSVSIPTSFYDQTGGEEFIKLDTTMFPYEPVTETVNGKRWLTKGISVPDFVLNAEDKTVYIDQDPYRETGNTFKTYFDDYFYTDKERETNAGYRFIQGDLNPAVDPSFEFGSGFQDRNISVSSITLAGNAARVVTTSTHGYVSGETVTISGANETEYNGTFVIKVTSSTEFYYILTSNPSSPATGTIISTDIVGTESNLITLLQNKNATSAFVDDVRRSIWDSIFIIPELAERTITDRFHIEENGVVNKNNLTAWTSFYGFYGLPFGKIFSTDGIAPTEHTLVSLDDYTAIRTSYTEIENTLENALKSSLIVYKFFIEENYIKAFCSINDYDNNADFAEYLRNYVTGYSNRMPMRFYNSFRIIIHGKTTDTGHSQEAVTAAQVDRIYQYSVNNFLNEFGDDTQPSLLTGKYIDDNFIFENNDDYDPGNVLAEDVNDTWFTIENGDLSTTNIKDLISVSGMQYLADNAFYTSRMEKSYIRIKMKFVFSRKAGRWITLDYRQFPTSYLTPTFGNVALKHKENSVVYNLSKGNNIDHYVPIYHAEPDSIQNIKISTTNRKQGIIRLNDSAEDEITWQWYNNAIIHEKDIMIYEPLYNSIITSPQKLSKYVITKILSMEPGTVNTGEYLLTFFDEIPASYTENIRISTTFNSIIPIPKWKYHRVNTGNVLTIRNKVTIKDSNANDNYLSYLSDYYYEQSILIYTETYKNYYGIPAYNQYMIAKITDVTDIVYSDNEYKEYTLVLDTEISSLNFPDTVKVSLIDTDKLYPYNAALKKSEKDLLWKHQGYIDKQTAYEQLYKTPYYKMIPMEINRFCLPFLSETFPYDTEGNIDTSLNVNNDLSNNENYKFSKLLDPVADIDFIVPNNVYGGNLLPDYNLFLFTPHMWKVYWHIRPAVCAMYGTLIPSKEDRDDGSMSDPVLNTMFIHPNLDDFEYSVPSYDNMEFNSYANELFYYNVIDAEIDDPIEDLERVNYDDYDAEIDDPVNDLYRECYVEIDAQR